MKKSILPVLVLTLLFTLTCIAHASTVYTFDDWAAELSDDGNAYLAASCSSGAADIAVPDTLGDKPVVGVAPHAFFSNAAMRSLKLTAPAASVGEYACFSCTALERVVLPYTITEIGEGAFSGASSLGKINLSDTQIAAVEPYTFSGTALTEVTLPSYCTAVKDFAFRNCASLERVYVPRTVTQIGESAFSGCDKLTLVGEEGSYAAAYAAEKGIPFLAIENTLYPYLNGDADGDGRITIMDATRVQRILVRLETEDTEFCSLRGDVDGIGLSIFDATAIQRYLAGMGNPYDINAMIYAPKDEA